MPHVVTVAAARRVAFGITPENVRGETDWGGAVGREVADEEPARARRGEQAEEVAGKSSVNHQGVMTSQS